ncbi:MAG: NIPSNAP family protein [Alphaproteobacteria bacterium]|nr:NIPSNAP family protein [Alphaproteobacteria bacterium]
MIYEVRTYRLQPRAVPGFVEAFGSAYEGYRKDFSPLAAFFYTDIGPLNQVIHIWPYEDAAHRAKVRAESAAPGKWPPQAPEKPVRMESEIFTPLPFIGDFASGNVGPVFEWRSYSVVPGMMPGVMEGWEAAIEARTKLSPLVMAMHTEVGELNKFVHIWGYESLAHRQEVREESMKSGIWPPAGSPKGAYSAQENKIVFAAPFSPVQ